MKTEFITELGTVVSEQFIETDELSIHSVELASLPPVCAALRMSNGATLHLLDTQTGRWTSANV